LQTPATIHEKQRLRMLQSLSFFWCIALLSDRRLPPLRPLIDGKFVASCDREA
jgi:hypothetical protein